MKNAKNMIGYNKVQFEINAPAKVTDTAEGFQSSNRKANHID